MDVKERARESQGVTSNSFYMTGWIVMPPLGRKCRGGACLWIQMILNDLGLGYVGYAITGGSQTWGWEQVQESDGTWTNSQMVVKPMRVHGIVQEDM